MLAGITAPRAFEFAKAQGPCPHLNVGCIMGIVMIAVREMCAADRATWSRMRCALWPDDSPQAHGAWIDEILQGDEAWGFIAQTRDGRPAGFAEVAVRKYANGCDSRPVPFLEGIWVEAELRRQGVGKALIRHVATFLAARGFSELGSDAEIDNRVSHASHRGWGFAETERVVYFRRALP
jgi:aminoglycoside 6'-N-acetyltransferase I